MEKIEKYKYLKDMLLNNQIPDPRVGILMGLGFTKVNNAQTEEAILEELSKLIPDPSRNDYTIKDYLNWIGGYDLIAGKAYKRK